MNITLNQANTRESLNTVAATAIEVPQLLIRQMPLIHAGLTDIKGDLSSRELQGILRQYLMANPAWADWIEQSKCAIERRPVLIKAGLGFERDDDFARQMLVGLALSLKSDSFVPPYAVGNQAVTEVIAQYGSTRASHSQNDLPAPPHTAGFFEEVPPHTCLFTCIRPHPLGGAETTVLNLDAVLSNAPQALIDEWSEETYLLKTSRRLGEQVLPFKLLRWIEGEPFLRYRKEYTVGFEADQSLKLLEELVCNPANHYIVPLKSGETLMHWNGTPHSRLAQIGDTPQALSERRKLIRCRTMPVEGWQEQWKLY